MILGRDLMTKLGIDISFDKQNITWEGNEIPMRDYNKLRKWRLSKYEMKTIIKTIHEPLVTEQSTNTMIKILDANYQSANLKQVIAGAKHLSQPEKDKLHKLLLKYESIFDRNPRGWETEPLPHSQQHYPVPKLHRETFRKELERLVKLGVLEKLQSSEWGHQLLSCQRKITQLGLCQTFTD